jgi:hypothetical protein
MSNDNVSLDDAMRTAAARQKPPPPRPKYAGNPFAAGSEHVTAQMWLIRHDPVQARSFISAAGLDAADYPSFGE